MMNWITIFLLLTFMTATLNDKDNQPEDTPAECTPFNAILIWHTGNGHNTSFIRQIHFIIKLVDAFPEDTEVSLVTVGAKLNTKLHFRKEMTDDSWKTKLLSHNPGESGTHIILNRKISDAILKYESPQMANSLFLVVDNTSLIADEQKAAKTLEKKNPFIVFYGKPTKKHGWADLVTDTRHFVLLKSNPDTIDITVKSILKQICRDFVPDAGSTMDDPCECHRDIPTIVNTFLLAPLFLHMLYEIVERIQRRRRTKGKKPVAEESQDNNQNYHLSDARSTMDHHQLKLDFMQLLKTTPSVRSQSRWDGVKANLEHDHRYQDVLTGSQREDWFDEYIQDLLKIEFMQLLKATPSVCSQSRWGGVKADLEQNHRCQDVLSDSQREILFDEYIQHLLKSDFMQLLKDSPSVYNRCRWEDVKSYLEDDHRYQNVPTYFQRKNWFDEYIQHLVQLDTEQNRRIDERPGTDGSYVDVAGRNNNIPPPNSEQGYNTETLSLLDQQIHNDE